MDRLFDDLARNLADPMTRRSAFRVVGGVFATAFFAMFAVEPLSARSCSRGSLRSGARSCSPGDDHDGDDCDDDGRFGDGRRDDRRHRGGRFEDDGICCPKNTCCAAAGRKLACCAKGSCVCNNGTCAPSSGSRCPSGCSRCGGSSGGGNDHDDRGGRDR